jgi:hypothetical protein
MKAMALVERLARAHVRPGVRVSESRAFHLAVTPIALHDRAGDRAHAALLARAGYGVLPSKLKYTPIAIASSCSERLSVTLTRSPSLVNTQDGWRAATALHAPTPDHQQRSVVGTWRRAIRSVAPVGAHGPGRRAKPRAIQPRTLGFMA